MNARVELHVERFVGGAAHEGQRHFGAGLAAEQQLDLIEAQALQALAVDGQDDVARFDAGRGRGRVVDGRNHFHRTAFDRDDDADAAILAFGPDLHVRVGLGIEIARMRIEVRDHARKRALDQELVVGRLDIIGAHDGESLTEAVERVIRRFRVRRGVGTGEHGQTGDETRRNTRCNKRETRHRITFPITGIASAKSQLDCVPLTSWLTFVLPRSRSSA